MELAKPVFKFHLFYLLAAVLGESFNLSEPFLHLQNEKGNHTFCPMAGLTTQCMLQTQNTAWHLTRAQHTHCWGHYLCDLR